MAARSRPGAPRVVRARWPEACRACDGTIDPGERAHLDPELGLTCLLCVDDPFAASRPDGPPTGPLAAALDRLIPDGILPLHPPPGSRPGIDHVVVAPTGVWVVASAHLAGPVRLRAKRRGGRARLFVNGRDETARLLDLDDAVRSLQRGLLECDVPDVAVHRVLCLVDTELRLLQRPVAVDGCLVTWPRALYRRLTAPGPVDAATRADLHRIVRSLLQTAG